MHTFKEFFNKLLLEGGAAGHMAHPYDITSNGKSLYKVFQEAIKYIKSDSASVKIDGINASLRLVDGKFVLDRGSSKPLDIKGIRPEDLESRFGSGHGFVEKGKKILDIFDSAYPSIKTELKALGMVDNKNITLNIEYVEGQTNVIKYKGVDNFLAIHNVLEIEPKSFSKSGKITSRSPKLKSYDKVNLENLIKKINIISEPKGFKVLSKIGIRFTKEPNLDRALSGKIKLNGESKSLKEWLFETSWKIPLITRKEYLSIASSDKNDLSEKQKSDYIVYLSTIKLGDEILANADSDLGPLSQQEGIVIERKGGSLYKITGSFILRGLESKFKEN
jgi:hypothetical protein